MEMECDSVRMWNENKMYRNVLFDLQCQCSRKLTFKRLKCSIWNSVVKISRRSLRLHKFTRTYGIKTYNFVVKWRKEPMVSLARDFLKSRAIVAVRSFLVSSVLRWLSGPGNATFLRKTPGSKRVLLRGPEDARNFFLLRCHYPLNYGQPWHASQWPLRGISSRTILLSHRRELNDPEKSA